MSKVFKEWEGGKGGERHHLQRGNLERGAETRWDGPRRLC